MSSFATNYSKWDHIELSDDESDLHPNIDKESWFRLKHRTRVEREQQEDIEKEKLKKENGENEQRLVYLRKRIELIEGGEADEDAEMDDVGSLKSEIADLEGQIAKRSKRIFDIDERRKWNIDNICRVTEEKTIVNNTVTKSLSDSGSSTASTDDTAKTSASASVASVSQTNPSTAKSAASSIAAPTSSSSAAAASPSAVVKGPSPIPSSAVSATSSGIGASPAREKFSVMSYNDFVIKHEHLLETFSEIADMDATKDYIFANCNILLHEHAQTYILLSCLEDCMNGKLKRMKLVCRQSQILTHIQELGVSLKRDPRDVILPFFKRLTEPEHLKGFNDSVEGFTKRIEKRAVEKRREMAIEEMRSSGQTKLGPGGLDPIEVLETLPEAMRDAFESADLHRLQEVLQSMTPEDAKYHMKRCVDSGLWVPNNPQEVLIEDEDEEVTEPEAAAAKGAAESEELDSDDEV